ncbi:MAG: hypothetical protein V3T22_00385, partial [Planctomycetota bacterium]
GLQLNLLKKVDKCEDKIIAMTTPYPHSSLIDMQRAGYEVSRMAAAPPPLEKTPDWQMEAAS